ncbi:MAG: hypothetical protein N3A61_04275 [Ignavibacteria bacterium]|nr:hypothetical protein [Ignavibacteria bacterium]
MSSIYFTQIVLLINLSIYAQSDEKFIYVEKSIYTRQRLINNAADIFNIRPRVLATIILTERYLNSNWLDDELDFLLLQFGINASVGFCQIKYETANWIEHQLNWSRSNYYFGKEFTKIIALSKTKDELEQKLQNDSTNILYAAAFLAMNIRRWKESGIDISENLEVLGTLYSNGASRPNKIIKLNKFGLNAKTFYEDTSVLRWFDN